VTLEKHTQRKKNTQKSTKQHGMSHLFLGEQAQSQMCFIQ